MKTSAVVVFLLSVVGGLWTSRAQTVHRCATHEVYENNAAHHAGYSAAVEHAFNYAEAYAQRVSANKTGDWDTLYRIPVVVHVVYNTIQQNIDDSLIYNQIEVLNQDYRRLNADTGDTRDIFKPVAADAGIEFFLATIDPDGNPTTGITRTYTDTPFFSVLGDILTGGTENGADYVKKTAKGGIDAWDTDNYLNIWVCNMKDPNSFFGLVLGFSYPPDNAPNWPSEAFPADPTLHGVVIHHEVFGRNNPLAVGPLDIANRGRTAVHEIGHFLGLRHIWGDGPLSILFPDCSVDDGIGDTPNSGNNSQTTGCDTTKNTCTEGNPDLPDMFENYMDYAREDCQNLFTEGQVAIMRAMLAASRSELPEIVTDSVPAGMVNVKNPDVRIYPNPSGGIFTLASSVPLNNFKRIYITDACGKTTQNFPPAVSDKIRFDLCAFPAGIYFAYLEGNGFSAVKKIVIQ
ncbi:MAG TPA: M43 family zinc metalloprotease [Chitinophagales bacterium]|nr:M43 family zinc metalloprotease [Chitinophagales bacterium]